MIIHSLDVNNLIDKISFHTHDLVIFKWSILQTLIVSHHLIRLGLPNNSDYVISFSAP